MNRLEDPITFERNLFEDLYLPVIRIGLEVGEDLGTIFTVVRNIYDGAEAESFDKNSGNTIHDIRIQNYNEINS